MLGAVGEAIDAAVSLSDGDMLAAALHAWEHASLRLQPSAAASFGAIAALIAAAAKKPRWPQLSGAIHVAWATRAQCYPPRSGMLSWLRRAATLQLRRNVRMIVDLRWEDVMNEDVLKRDKASSTKAIPSSALAGDDPRAVLQVERRDYVDLAPVNRPRVQSLEGFDDCYTDIVDYIVRCTHRIWDERDVGLIYTHYTHNAAVYYTNGAVYDREAIVRDTLARLTAFPERRGMATQVIWRGDDRSGFYTSHYVTGSGRHSQPGQYGRPTGRFFNTRTVADCMVYRNRIYREWIATDSMGLLRQIGIDPHPVAEKLAQDQFARGLTPTDIGETFRMMGQYPPELEAYGAPAHNEVESWTLSWLHEVFNRRMFGTIRKVYAPNTHYHGTRMRELYGVAAVMHQTIALVGMIPDMALPGPPRLLEPERGRRRQGRRALDDGGAPPRLRLARRPHRASGSSCWACRIFT